MPKSEKEFPVGPPIVGIILTGVLGWSLLNHEIELVMFISVLLVILTIGVVKILN